MQRQFLLLMAVCALATALPRDKRFEEIEYTTVNNVSKTTTENKESGSETKPKSKVIDVNTVGDMSKRISEAGDKLVVVYIMSNQSRFSLWIAPCIESLANKVDNVVVLKLAIDVIEEEVAKIPRDYKEYIDFKEGSTIQLPVIGFLKNGSKLEYYEDGYDPRKLRDTVAKYIAKH